MKLKIEELKGKGRWPFGQRFTLTGLLAETARQVTWGDLGLPPTHGVFIPWVFYAETLEEALVTRSRVLEAVRRLAETLADTAAPWNTTTEVDL